MTKPTLIIAQLEDRVLAKRRESLSTALARVKDVKGWATKSATATTTTTNALREKSSASASTAGSGGGGGGGGKGSLARALSDADDAVASLSSLLSTTDDSGGGGNAEDTPSTSTTRTLRDHADDPVFSTLSAPHMLRLLVAATELYRKDIDVKLEMLEAVETAAERGMAGTASKARAGAGAGGSPAKQREQQKDLLISHETLTTCVATWILSPYVDASVTNEIDTIAALEMK